MRLVFPILRGFSLGFSRRLLRVRRRRARSFSFLSPRGPEHLRELAPGGVELGARRRRPPRRAAGRPPRPSRVSPRERLRGERRLRVARRARRRVARRQGVGAAPHPTRLSRSRDGRARALGFELRLERAHRAVSVTTRAPRTPPLASPKPTPPLASPPPSRGGESLARRRRRGGGGARRRRRRTARRTPRTPRAEAPRRAPLGARARGGGVRAGAARSREVRARGSCVASRLRRRALERRDCVFCFFVETRHEARFARFSEVRSERVRSRARLRSEVAEGERGRPRAGAGQGLEHRAVQRGGRLRARDRGGRDVREGRCVFFLGRRTRRDVRERRRGRGGPRGRRSSLHGGRGRIGHARRRRVRRARIRLRRRIGVALRLGRLGRVGCVRNRDVSRGRLRSLSLGPLPLESLELQLPGELLLLLGLLRRHRLDDSRRLPPARRRMMGATTRNEPGNFAARKRHKRDDEARGPSPRLAGGRQRLAGCRR